MLREGQMKRLPVMVTLLCLPLFSASHKQVPDYQAGTMLGWRQTPAAYSTTPVRGTYGSVHPRSTITYGQKFYEMQGAGMVYTLNNCGKFEPRQGVQYGTNGDWIYIAKPKGKEYKCRIMGARTTQEKNSQKAAHE